MPKKDRFIFKIDGLGDQKVTPETVKLRDLMALLADFENAVAITAKSSGATADDDLDFSLVSVEEGSDEVGLAASPKMFKSTCSVSGAFAKNDFSKIPQSAHPSLRKMWGKMKNSGWKAELHSDWSNFPASVISPERELFLPHEISGGTSLLGKLDRIGNEQSPTAKLILLSGETITASIPSRDMALELKERLFEVVSLDGVATWNVDSWKLEAFKITRIGDFKDTKDMSAAQAFANLSVVVGNHWDDVDPEEFVEELRAD